MIKKFTPEILDFLKQNVKGRSIKELTVMVNAHFGLSFTEAQIKYAKNECGLKIGIQRTTVFTPEQITFLENNVPGKPFAELAVLFNKRFKTDFASAKIKNFCVRRGLKNNMVRVKNGHYWTKGELSFLEQHAGEKTNRELTALINNGLNLSLTSREVRYACGYYNIKAAKVPNKFTREIGDFIRQNPGEKAPHLTKMINSTFGTVFSTKQVGAFITSNKHKTVYKHVMHELPLYTERIKGDGHIHIKFSMEGTHGQMWKEKHRWLWEQANGKIPEGMVIIFLDNNPLNCTLENLAMVSRAEHVEMLNSGLYTSNPEMTRVGITIARHFVSIHNRLKKELGPKGHKRFLAREYARRKQGEKKGREGTK
jgi:hypothetical protein